MIELLVIMVIMTMLVGTTTVAVFKVRTTMQMKAAKVDIRTMSMALAAYRRELGCYPPDFLTEDDLNWVVDSECTDQDACRSSNEALVYYLGRKHLRGANVYGPYIEFKEARLVNRDAASEGTIKYPEYLDPFGRYYLYAENRSQQNDDGTGSGRNVGSYDIVSPGRDGMIGGTMSAQNGYAVATSEYNKTLETDNITNWSK